MSTQDETDDLFQKLSELELNDAQTELLGAMIGVARDVMDGNQRRPEEIHRESVSDAFTPLGPEKVRLILDYQNAPKMIVKGDPATARNAETYACPATIVRTESENGTVTNGNGHVNPPSPPDSGKSEP